MKTIHSILDFVSGNQHHPVIIRFEMDDTKNEQEILSSFFHFFKATRPSSQNAMQLLLDTAALVTKKTGCFCTVTPADTYGIIEGDQPFSPNDKLS